MPATKEHPYETRLNILHRSLELIDEKALSDSVTHKWFNQTLCQVNDSVVRVGVVQGEYHWHKHDNDDEFFYVVEGNFLIDYCLGAGEQEMDESGNPASGYQTVDLKPRQGFVVPKWIMHRPRAPIRSVILMVETSAIVPTGS
jgi:mannose-6-phosphate isomerase-like protein (cupin superfamily)